jgi:hypothetical protein
LLSNKSAVPFPVPVSVSVVSVSAGGGGYFPTSESDLSIEAV